MRNSKFEAYVTLKSLLSMPHWGKMHIFITSKQKSLQYISLESEENIKFEMLEVCCRGCSIAAPLQCWHSMGCSLAKLHHKKQLFIFRCLEARLFFKLLFLSEHQFTALFLSRHPPAYIFRHTVADGLETNLQFTIRKLSWFNNEHDEM